MRPSAPDEKRVPSFACDTPAEQIAKWVDSVRLEAGCGEFLVALLSEQLAFYQGRSSNEVSHIRGYIMAAFEKTGLPQSGVPLVIEELESGHLAYEVGAAAIALRGLECASPEIAPYLFQAIENIRYRDDFVCYDTFSCQPVAARSKTALQEIFRTFAWMGIHAESALQELDRLDTDPCIVLSARVRADLKAAVENIRTARDSQTVSLPSSACCMFPALSARWINFRQPKEIKETIALNQLPLEDQDGNHLVFADFFRGEPAIVAFFYTRCDNPRKCSLTISKLALLQKAIHSRGLGGRLKIAGFTYDPTYDSASRLKIYGRERGMSFDENTRLFRAVAGLDRLREHFDLGVGFLNSIVNRHRIELYILDGTGRIAASITRLQWDIRAVLDHAAELLPPGGVEHQSSEVGGVIDKPRPIAHASRLALLSSVPASLLVIAPKCPVCWAAWLGALGIAGWGPTGAFQWLLPVSLGIVVVQVVIAFMRTRANGRGAALLLVLGGILLLLAGKANDAAAGILLVGLALLAAGFFVSFLPGRAIRPPSEGAQPRSAAGLRSP